MPGKRANVQIPARKILQHLAHGFKLEEMAAHFGVTVGTMRHRVRLIYRQFEMKRENAGHAVQIAHTQGLLRKCAQDCGLCKKANQRKTEGS